MPLATDILAYLQGLDLVDGTSGFKGCTGYMPPTPDQVIVLTEYAGAGPLRNRTSDPIEKPRLQVRVRGPAEFDDTGAALAQLAAIRAVLDEASKRGGIVVDGTTYPECLALESGVIPLGYDEQDHRPEYAQNFEVWRNRS